MTEQKRKTVWKHWVAVGLVPLLAIGVFVVAILNALAPFGDDAMRCEVPGECEIELDEAGTYTIYHEHSGYHSGTYYSWSPGSVSLRCEVLPPDVSDPPVALDPVMASMTYSLNEKAGRAVFTFEADAPGTYTLSAESDRNTCLVVVPRGPGRLSGMLILSMFTCFGSAALFAGLLVWAIVRTVSIRKQAATAPAPPGITS